VRVPVERESVRAHVGVHRVCLGQVEWTWRVATFESSVYVSRRCASLARVGACRVALVRSLAIGAEVITF
jgi:hypothetical protein